MFTHNRKQAVSILAMVLAMAGHAAPALAQEADAGTGSAQALPRTSAFERKLTALTGKAGGLTSKQVAARTVAGSPDVAAKRADVERAAADVDRAIAAYFPRLSLTGKYTRLNSIDDGVLGPFVVAPGIESGNPVPAGSTLAVQSMAIESVDNQWSFQASLTAPLSDYPLRLVDTHKSAEHSARASQLDLRASTRRAGYDARVLYYNWVKAELAIVVAEQSLELAK
jgi:outer membrane protein TolC